MLLSFMVENFRSFAGAQRLSLNAGRFHTERIGAVMDTCSKSSPHVLRALAIMGSNGSGKSSFIEALDFFQGFVKNSAQKMQRGDRIPVQAHRLDKSYVEKPSSFEASFLHNGVEFTYAFSLNRTQVVKECLHSREKNELLREVFSRTLVGDDDYRWNLGLLPEVNARLWQQSTRDNALYLSTAVQLNSEELTTPFEWITEYLRIQTTSDDFSASLTAHMIKDHVEDGCRTAILNLLREADLGIRNIEVSETAFDEASISNDVPEEIRKRLVSELKGQMLLESKFEHRTRQGDIVAFDLEDESGGTQKLYEMAGAIVASLMHNYTLVVDELDASLHPFILRLIIDRFQNPENLETSAQLIFSTHDDGLLDSKLLERDQFVFVEKRRGVSEIIPLHDYRPRKGEAIRLNYLRGRYGGVPAISRVKVN